MRMRRSTIVLAGLTMLGAAIAAFQLRDTDRRIAFKYNVAALLNAAAERIVPTAPQANGMVATPLESVLSVLAKQRSLSIVQIGAYIGDTSNDPLCGFLREHLNPAKPTDPERNIKVVLVEPIREYFDLLCKNYDSFSSIEFANVAIAERDGVMDMFRLAVDPVEFGYPAWLAQLSSLKKQRMEKLWDEYEANPDYKQFYLKHRIVEQVRCMTLEQLLEKHQIQQLDLLQIDAEGYDFEILKTLNFETVKPRFINYERVLLQEDEPRCREMLAAQGYLLIDWGQDTLCIRLDGSVTSHEAAGTQYSQPGSQETE